MKKILSIVTILIISISLVACNFAEEKEYNLDNPTRVAILSLDILDILNEVDFDKTGIKELGILFKGRVDYLEQFNTKEVVDLGTHNAFNELALQKLEPELIILGSRVSSMEIELKKKFPKAEIYNATHNISIGELTDTLNKNVEFLGNKFPLIKDDLNNKFTTIKDDIAAVKALNTKENRALVVILSGTEVRYYGADSRFGMIFKEFGFKNAGYNTENDDSHGEAIGFEAISDINPEVVFVLDRSSTINSDGERIDFNQFVTNGKNFNIPAFMNEKIYQLDGNAWYMTSGGFRSANTMIIDMNQYLVK